MTRHLLRTLRFFSFLAFLVVSIFATSVSPLCAQPILGYVYPAGVQQGGTTRIVVCGRNMNGTFEVVVSGDGVTAKVLQSNLLLRSNNGDDTIVLRRMLMEARKKMDGEKDTTVSITQVQGYNPNNVTTLPSDEQLKNKYMYFRELEKPTAELLQMVYYEYFGGPERRVIDSLRNVVSVEITADKTATPGDRHLRLRTNEGLSAPIRFIVGTHKEMAELEPNDTEPNNTETNTFFWNTKWKMVSLPPQEVPITFNGRIRAGDVDRLSFIAKKGQRLTILGRARHLVPFLADAVPGWFELHITIFDENGKKVDVQSPKQYDPDPVLFFTVPANGTYTAVVQDSIFRGRDDFIYRISVDTTPYITGMFPLGRSAMGNEPEDIPVESELYGWLPPTRKIPLPPQITIPSPSKSNEGTPNLVSRVAPSVIPYGPVGEIPSIRGRMLPNPLQIGYSFLPECFETAAAVVGDVATDVVSNGNSNGKKAAMPISLPVIINGRIDTKNEVDSYTFSGKKGQTIVCDLVARSLGGLLDASLQLCDSDDKVVVQNDDRADSKGPNIGLCTHHVDPYLMAELPADGVYTVRVYSTLNHFGNEYGYRLRVSEPMPDFTVFAGPSGLYMLRNQSQTITATVLRHDGFDGEIKLWVKSVGGNPSGAVTTRNGTIPKEATTHTFTVAADRTYTGNVVPLRLEATAQVGKVTISHEVVPVDNAEQAFIYKHLLPTDTFLMSGRK